MTEETPVVRLPFAVLALTVTGIGLTLAAGVAAVYASGFHLSQPIAEVHILPLGVIVVVVLVGGLLGLEEWALRQALVAPLVAAAGAAGLATILILVLGPTASRSTPIGPALPWLVVSLGAALLGVVALLLAQVGRRRHGYAPRALILPVATSRGVLAVVLALVLNVGLGAGARRMSSSYLSGVNEYRENPIASVGSPARSSLDGGVLWQVSLPPVPRVPPVSTPYGIVVTAGRAVIELDATTGRVRWRYERSDVDAGDDAQVPAINGGRELAVRWLRSGFFALDARTGARVTRWPSTYATDEFDGADPTLVRHPDSSDTTTLTALTDRGARQWRYTTKNCQYAHGLRTASVVLVQVTDQCTTSEEMLGLDPDSGHQRWAIDPGKVRVLELTDTIAVVTAAEGGPSPSLTGIDVATGAARWKAAVQADGPCSGAEFQSQANSIAALCTTSASTTADTWLLRYDVATGKLLERADLGDVAIQSETMTADGRVVLLTRSPRTPTCPVVVVHPDGNQTTLPDVPVASGCFDAVQAVGDQVLLVNVVTDQVRALR